MIQDRPRYRLPREARVNNRQVEETAQIEQRRIEEAELRDKFVSFRPQIIVAKLTQPTINNGWIVLPEIPMVPTSVLLTPVGGIPQVYGKDFIIKDRLLIWNNLGLDGFLDTEDTLIIQY